MDAVLRALVEPRRRQILKLIGSQELCAGEISAQFDITRPAISQHLKVLKEANLVTERRNGTHRYYRARPESLAELRASLESFWDDTLELLRRAAENEERMKKQP